MAPPADVSPTEASRRIPLNASLIMIVMTDTAMCRSRSSSTCSALPIVFCAERAAFVSTMSEAIQYEPQPVSETASTIGTMKVIRMRF